MASRLGNWSSTTIPCQGSHAEPILWTVWIPRNLPKTHAEAGDPCEVDRRGFDSQEATVIVCGYSLPSTLATAVNLA
jgi:hypothetical protein